MKRQISAWQKGNGMVKMYRDAGEGMDVWLRKHEKERTKTLWRDITHYVTSYVAKYDIKYDMQYKKLRSNVSGVS